MRESTHEHKTCSRTVNLKIVVMRFTHMCGIQKKDEKKCENVFLSRFTFSVLLFFYKRISFCTSSWTTTEDDDTL